MNALEAYLAGTPQQMDKVAAARHLIEKLAKARAGAVLGSKKGKGFLHGFKHNPFRSAEKMGREANLAADAAIAREQLAAVDLIRSGKVGSKPHPEGALFKRPPRTQQEMIDNAVAVAKAKAKRSPGGKRNRELARKHMRELMGDRSAARKAYGSLAGLTAALGGGALVARGVSRRAAAKASRRKALAIGGGLAGLTGLGALAASKRD